MHATPNLGSQDYAARVDARRDRVVARLELTLALHPSILERLSCVQTRRLLGSSWRLEGEAMSILTILIGVVLAIVI
jgi:hypothetical protein